MRTSLCRGLTSHMFFEAVLQTFSNSLPRFNFPSPGSCYYKISNYEINVMLGNLDVCYVNGRRASLSRRHPAASSLNKSVFESDKILSSNWWANMLLPWIAVNQRRVRPRSAISGKMCISPWCKNCLESPVHAPPGVSLGTIP